MLLLKQSQSWFFRTTSIERRLAKFSLQTLGFWLTNTAILKCTWAGTSLLSLAHLLLLLSRGGWCRDMKHPLRAGSRTSARTVRLTLLTVSKARGGWKDWGWDWWSGSGRGAWPAMARRPDPNSNPLGLTQASFELHQKFCQCNSE